MRNWYHYCKVHIFSSHFVINPGHFKQYFDQSRCESTRQDCIFKKKKKNWSQSLNVHLFEYRGWSKLYVHIVLATLYFTMWSPIMYLNKWIVMFIIHYNVCEIWIFYMMPLQRLPIFHYFVFQPVGFSPAGSSVDSSHILSHKSHDTCLIDLKGFVCKKKKKKITYTEKPKWVIWLIWAIVGHYTDKKTHFLHIFESFCPCTDPLWLKWVKWLIWVFLCTKWHQNFYNR